MDDLLPYYERELTFLRRYSADFAQRYPKTAGRLAMNGEHVEDPHVERLIESFAFLGARISKKIEDDYPEFTDALLEVLYPHYLRPFPASSVAQFTGTPAVGQLTQPLVIPRGTELMSHPVRGMACTFRTAHDVALAPVRVSEAKYALTTVAPSLVSLPTGATAIISITLESTAPQMDVTSLKLDRLRVHLSGDQPLIAALQDSVFLHTLKAYVEPARSGRWTALPVVPLSQAGFDDEDALIDYPARSHPAYRLLTEYFAFPDQFSFVDFDLAAMAKAAGPCQRLTLHLVLKEVRADSHVASLLGALSAHHLRLFCTPVVNLFQVHADPVRSTHAAPSYPVIVNGRYASAYEVYSIDTVSLVRKTGNGEDITELRPFYSLRHGEQSQAGRYWFARRNEWVARQSPGYETEISVVDLGFNPADAALDTLSIDITATNRDLPGLLSTGLEGGDLFIDGNDLVERVALLMRPTALTRFDRREAAHWRLISHLSLNHLSLLEDGAATLREMLLLYDQRHTAVSARHIDGIVKVQAGESIQWMAGKPFPTFVRGIEIRLTLDEEHFAGVSIATFIAVLDRFFGLYVHINSFTQLVVLSKRSGQEIIRCQPRSGDAILV
ncbi:type VI secretion system baseplate subunit TssF [Paraburkholderia tropica]|uniref:type VI secretion system baseplate subunit TssF n=1 Tax=Paraburkholderia tropica TaxID=92647 RepID=UPI0007ECDC29|nr:type VI secretion system baseplate subunit TssF [Paraburkholderia tropica]OBR48510.1 type VI secretion protein [Paraburkholderia tropica]